MEQANILWVVVASPSDVQTERDEAAPAREALPEALVVL